MEQVATGLVAGAKPWWMSRTILGALGTGAVLVAGFFGVSIDEATKTVILDQTEAMIGAAFALVTVLVTIWGRVAAKKAIG